jgi:hypothetical protein
VSVGCCPGGTGCCVTGGGGATCASPSCGGVLVGDCA